MQDPLTFMLLLFVVFLGPFIGGLITFLTPKEHYSIYHTFLEKFTLYLISLVALFLLFKPNITQIILTLIAIVLLYITIQFTYQQHRQIIYFMLGPVLLITFFTGYAPVFASLIFFYGLFIGAQDSSSDLTVLFSDQVIKYSLFLVTGLILNLFSLAF